MSNKYKACQLIAKPDFFDIEEAGFPSDDEDDLIETNSINSDFENEKDYFGSNTVFEDYDNENFFYLKKLALKHRMFRAVSS